MTTVPTLTDGVVTLRPYTLDDLDSCVEQCTDPETVEWTTVPAPYTRDDAVEWVTKTVPAGWATETDLAFAIEEPGVRSFCGGIALRPGANNSADLGFSLHPAARGRGLSARAIGVLADWAFAERGVKILTWHAFADNWASRRVVWANGFSFDGRIEGFLTQRGRQRAGWLGTLRATDTREPKSVWHIAPVLESETLRMRPFADADAARLGEMYGDERTRHFGGRLSALRGLDGEAALRRIREKNATGEMMDWAVADRTTDQILGRMQLFNINGFDPSAVNPGYLVHPDARGRGVLTESLAMLTEWTLRPVADGGFGKRRIVIETAASNGASRHAAAKAGYTHVSTEPAAFPIGEIDFDDLVIYHRVNPDWQA